ncbi:hypothetical protein, partial [Pseudomonas aeruginosa]|uniref:hypothetical protein n=1 Tax=Pseudomonas aeruginosa TaxID=287 RepID=UPI001F4A57D0
RISGYQPDLRKMPCPYAYDGSAKTSSEAEIPTLLRTRQVMAWIPLFPYQGKWSERRALPRMRQVWLR